MPLEGNHRDASPRASGDPTLREADKGPEADGRTAALVNTAVRIDRVVHERMRLAIVSALTLSETLTFTELKKLLGATDGNLIVHARRLEDAGYVSCSKALDGRVQRTTYRLTPAGRAALTRYIAQMQELLHTLQR